MGVGETGGRRETEGRRWGRRERQGRWGVEGGRTARETEKERDRLAEERQADTQTPPPQKTKLRS